MTDQIKVEPDTLDTLARQIDDHVKTLNTALAKVNDIVYQLDPARFEGVRADRFRSNYRAKHERITGFTKVLGSFSYQLKSISHQFREGDRLLASGLMGGSILGAASASLRTTWARNQELFNRLNQEKMDLLTQLELLNGKIDGQLDVKGLQSELNALIAKRDDLSAQADKIINQILPDIKDPLGDNLGDGMFWRTKADSINEEIQKIDANIAYLTNQLHLQNQKNSITQNINNIQSQMDAVAPGDYAAANLNIYQEPYPQYGTHSGKCAAYVRKITGDKGVASAKDFTSRSAPFSYEGDLRNEIEPGKILAWKAKQGADPVTGKGGADPVDGHAAVIIEVHENHVVLAESATGKYGSSWSYDPKYSQDPKFGLDGIYAGRIIPKDKLQGLYVVDVVHN